MKNTLSFFVLALLFVSCTSEPPKPTNSDVVLIEAVKKAQDARKNGEPEQALNELQKVLLSLPEQPPKNDSALYAIYGAFSEYCSTVLTLRTLQPGIDFLEQLALSGKPILKQHLRPELIAMRAHFYYMSGRSDRAIELADSFALLPPMTEAMRIARYNEMVTNVYYYSNKIEKAILFQEKAAEAYRRGEYTKSKGRVLAWLGVYYLTAGKYEEAIKINQEAFDFYKNNPEDQSTVVVYGQQSVLYEMLNMNKQAMEMADKAIYYSLRNGEYNLGDVYRFKSVLFKKQKVRDSAFYYINKTEEIARENKLSYSLFACKLVKLDIYQDCPDSIARARLLIDSMIADSAKVPPFMRAQLNLSIGEIMLKSSQLREAVGPLERAATVLQSAGMSTFEIRAREYLMECYSRMKNSEGLSVHFDRFRNLTDTLKEEERVRAMVAANVRFDTQLKEEQNQLLKTEVELKNSRLHNYTLSGGALLVVGLCVGCWFWMRQRSLNLHLRLEQQEKLFATTRIREQEERLQQLIFSRQELNNHNEELLRQLAEVQAKNEKSCDLDKVMESLQPRLLTSVEEEQFRTTFNNLYPMALHHLRSFCSKVTRADELLCMLVLLKQTNEEIARTLGISRPSVIQSRYRLRVKLNLAEGVDFDEKIRKIMVGEDDTSLNG